MKTIEEIALEVCEKIGPVAMCKNPLAFAELVVSAVDAERGKDAVAKIVTYIPTRGRKGVINVTAYCPIDSELPAHKKVISTQPLFLSPTIPLGFALVPIDPSEEWIAKVVRVNQPDLDIGCRAWREEVESLEYWHRAIAKAAGVTK